ncbi:MAG: MoaD/ThiS family protein [Coriobacteriia bacterium]|nr:MoaD/ThiS family protein [Coriobacteriia bacterium]
MVLVKLFAFFREGRGKELEVAWHEGLTAGEIIDDLGIERERVAILLINGRHQTPETVLEDGQKLFLFPPVAGG